MDGSASGQTLWSDATAAEMQEETKFGINCEDFEVINNDGEQLDWLSEIADPTE
ncbi:hypothetical protein SH661x_001934 [Planctomicrobium sp. SH661]|uniref:hypothetical protein n=1 Tax=Planctomicrobium sp. SH661 TaxID=3448124 RepID=UPI003F5C78DB